MKHCLLIVLLVSLILFVPHFETFASDEPNDDTWYDAGDFRSSTYVRRLKTWLTEYQVINDANQTITPNVDLNPLISSVYDENYGDVVFEPAEDDLIVYQVTVADAGLYQLSLDYCLTEEFNKSPEISVFINDEIPFNELSNLALEVEWENQAKIEGTKYNRYGDELLPSSKALTKWYHHFLDDTMGKSNTPFYLLLNEGLNTISIRIHDDNLLFGDLYIGGSPQIPGYDTYRNQVNAPVLKTEKIDIQAEKFLYKNDIEIKADYYKSCAMQPSNHKNAILNLLDGDSMSRGGTKVTYQFDVSKSGYYQLSFKYQQTSLAGIATARNIYIDNEIPFQAMQNYLFPSTKKWTNLTLGEDHPYYFYLSEGTHTLTIESTTAHLTDVIDQLYTVMDELSSIGLMVKSITGNSNNAYIDWDILKYLPNLVDDLNSYADELDSIYDFINELNSTSSQAAEISTLKVASKQLRRIAKDPNDIQNKLGELSEGGNSAYQLIGTTIGILNNQTLDIDFVSFHGDEYQLPKPNGNFFQRIWFGIKSFFYSFFDDRYRPTSNRDEDTLEIWVAQSSLYLNIIQNMVDETYTPETGTKVRLNILPSPQKLVLNNATGTNPDLVLGIDSWIPYTYALRGMLEDLSQFEGFDQVTNEIYRGNFTPLIFEDGVYGIPETQGMQLLFYRTDILSFLGLDPPDTWDDVIKMLPTLQSYQMNFYHPLGSDSAYKGFGYTAPFFALFGAEVYSDNGFQTNINNQENIEAVQFMTDLFNIYNLPLQVASFFEHFRSGTLPIGIGPIDLYLQLKYASPELTGQWAVAPIPGFLNEESGEVERWETTYGKCSIMFSKSKMKDEAWDFLNWWHSDVTQTEYNRNIKLYLGEKYLIAPANIKSLKASYWDEEIKDQIVKQSRWSRIPAITPGSYIVEREISNIWNKIVIDKMNVRVAINQSVPKMNRELERKFTEFGYLKDGEIMKEYVVPNYDNLEQWVKGYGS